MLGVHIDALGGRALHLGRAQLAGQEAVLGIILKVAAGEGGAVDVHARRVQADDAVGQRLRAEDAAEFLDQRFIPGRTDDDLAREGDAAQGADQGVDAGRAVEVGGRGLADGGDGGRGPAAVEDHGRHVLIAELLQQQLPLGIVPVKTGHVLQREAVVGVDDSGIAVIDLIGRLLGEGQHHRVGGSLAVDARGRGRARPVGAGDVDRDLAVLHVGEMRDGGGLIGGARVALAEDDGLRDGVGAAVDQLMRILHQLDLIVAGLEHIAARAEAVEGGHVLRLEGDGHGLGGAGLKQAGLAEASEHDVRLFDTALRVGGGVIDLHHVLAGNVAGVRDLHLHGDGTVAVGVALDALLKARVAQAVAEGVLHGAVVVDEAVRGRRLIVAIADVDALGVLDVVAGAEIAVSKVARVPVGGGGGEVVGVGVDQAAGGIDLAGQRAADRVEAHRAGAADPEAGVDAVLEEAELHRVGGVDEHDDLREALRLHDREQVFLILRQLQIVPPVVGLAVAGSKHVLRQVAALAADAGEDDDRGVGEVLRLLQHRVGVGGGGHLGRGEVRAGVAALLGALDAGALIELHELFVDDEAGVLQALDDVHVRGGVAGAAARAAVDRIDRAVAEEIDLAAACKRQRVILVAEQHDALRLQLFCHSETLRRRVRDAEDLRALGGLGAGDQGIQIDAHPGCDHGFERTAGDVDRQREDQKDGKENDAAFFHCCDLSSKFVGVSGLTNVFAI